MTLGSTARKRDDPQVVNSHEQAMFAQAQRRIPIGKTLLSINTCYSAVRMTDLTDDDALLSSLEEDSSHAVDSSGSPPSSSHAPARSPATDTESIQASPRSPGDPIDGTPFSRTQSRASLPAPLPAQGLASTSHDVVVGRHGSLAAREVVSTPSSEGATTTVETSLKENDPDDCRERENASNLGLIGFRVCGCVEGSNRVLLTANEHVDKAAGVTYEG